MTGRARADQEAAEYERVFELIDETEHEEQLDVEKLRRVLLETECLLSKYWVSESAHYLRGYALFVASVRGFALKREGLAELEMSLHIYPDGHWARWYAIVLAAHLRDDGRVIGLFAELDRSFFTEDGKDWRYLKAWEYALCAHLRLGNIERFTTGLRALIQEFVNVTDDPDEILERPNQVLDLYREMYDDEWTGPEREPLISFIEEQMARLVPGHWIRPGPLRDQIRPAPKI